MLYRLTFIELDCLTDLVHAQLGNSEITRWATNVTMRAESSIIELGMLLFQVAVRSHMLPARPHVLENPVGGQVDVAREA